jgi:two-component system NtrC family sensor kinase
MTRLKVGNLMSRAPSLRWRIVTVLLVAALLPLGIAGLGSWIVFGDLLEEKAREQMRTLVRSHASAIDSYLAERVSLLQLLGASTSIDRIGDEERLRDLLGYLDLASGGGFVDLGAIDAGGNHIAYAGPYDLRSRNYLDAEWFREVMERGAYVSDVFLGFRQVPHCIVAVKQESDREPWILRATINSAQFDELVGGPGEHLEAYIVNGQGLYQSSPMAGALLEAAPVQLPERHAGVRERDVNESGTAKIEVTTWINDNRWMLVVRQDRDAIRAPVNQAIARGAYVVLFAVLLLVATTFLATRHLTRKIDSVTAEREEMSRAFMRSAKLASIGELSTGLAHEINNPLATISAEQTNIADLAGEMKVSPQATQILDSVQRSKAQVQRCASITKKMLQFGREREVTLELANIRPRLAEIVDLMRRRAAVRNIEIRLDVAEGLPPVLIDPLELEQVVVNLINNSIDALPSGGRIALRARHEDDQVHVVVEDNGTGIDSGDLDRVFEPFFTTKPPGAGTGLGLSVCYGIVHSWGGSMRVRSERGVGTTVQVLLPLRDHGASINTPGDGERPEATRRGTT